MKKMYSLYLTEPKPIAYKGCLIKIPIYEINLYIGVYKELPNDSLAHVIATGDSSIWCIVKESEVDNLGVIVHECDHIVYEIGSYISEQLEGESRAYLISYIFNQICNKISSVYKAKRN